MMGQKKEGTAMDIKKLIQNKTFRLLLTAVLVLLIGVLGAKPAWYALTDTTFYWRERTETEIRVKTFKDGPIELVDGGLRGASEDLEQILGGECGRRGNGRRGSRRMGHCVHLGGLRVAAAVTPGWQPSKS